MILVTAAAFISFSAFGLGGNAVNFDSLKPGSFPPFWTSPAGQPGHWEIRRDGSAPSRPNIFAQTLAAGGDTGRTLAIYDRVICRDGDLSVKFRISAKPGKARSTGIVWRYKDPGNYYLLRFNLDQKNIGIFRVRNGQPSPVAVKGGKPGMNGVTHDFQADQWYVAKAMFRGSSVRVLFGNRFLFEAVDEAPLNGAGKTGLWTREGTVASFDDFRIDKKS